MQHNVPNEIPAVFHKGSNYDHHFIIKELANKFEGNLNEQYKTFSVPTETEVINADKDGNETVVTTSYKIKFIHIARFMATSLSNLVDSLTKGMHKIKYQNCDCLLEYESVNDNLIKYKCFSCNKNYSNKADEKLNKGFRNTFKFSYNAINKLILLFRKGVEYTEEWEKFNETTLPEKEEFYNNLNVEAFPIS